MKTLTEIPVPVNVIDATSNYIATTYPGLSESHKSKLFSKLAEVWFYIYSTHSEERNRQLPKFHNHHIDNIYVNISRTILSTFQIRIGSTIMQYTELIRILNNCGLIDINHSYEVGKNPKSYRPNPEIRYELTRTIPINLEKFIKANHSKSDLLKSNPGYESLINNLYLVKIDLPNFFEEIENSIGQTYKWDKGEPKVLTAELAYRLKIKAIKINLGIHFFSVSSTGRIYSSLANLPKVCLPHVTLNGLRPIEIDAKNCQPLLLSSIIKNQEFQTDCEAGVFYDRMADHLGITRTEFKMLSYAQIFFNNKKINAKTVSQLESVYPGLATQINAYKCKSKKEAAAVGDENLLWYRLQSLEAKIFIQTALKQLTPVITRHDSILCLPTEVDAITEQLTSAFKKIGIDVKLSIS
jgi:hypothetical protein